MSSRRVQRRTVAGYVQSSRFQLEKGIAAAVKCGEITRDELLALRIRWRELDELVERLTRKGRRNPNPKARR